jgi:hypothetical protein
MPNKYAKPDYNKINKTMDDTMYKALHTESVGTPKKIVKNIQGGK